MAKRVKMNNGFCPLLSEEGRPDRSLGGLGWLSGSGFCSTRNVEAKIGGLYGKQDTIAGLVSEQMKKLADTSPAPIRKRMGDTPPYQGGDKIKSESKILRSAQDDECEGIRNRSFANFEAYR